MTINIIGNSSLSELHPSTTHTPSYLLLLLEANSHVRLILPGLLVQALQDLVGVGVDVEIHLLVIVLQQVLGVRAQLLEDLLSGFDVVGFAWDYVDDEML